VYEKNEASSGFQALFSNGGAASASLVSSCFPT